VLIKNNAASIRYRFILKLLPSLELNYILSYFVLTKIYSYQKIIILNLRNKARKILSLSDKETIEVFLLPDTNE